MIMKKKHLTEQQKDYWTAAERVEKIYHLDKHKTN